MGVFVGLISLVLFYFLLSAIRMTVIKYFGNPYMLKPPTIQLLTMLINIILFRLLIINFKKEETGKGLLFITVLVTLGYFFLHF